MGDLTSYFGYLKAPEQRMSETASERGYVHGMTPKQTHDEVARENAVRAMRFHIYAQVSQGTRGYFTNVVAPEFEKTQGRPLTDRHEVRKVLEERDYVQLHSILATQRARSDVEHGR